ncbi:hypothetical protein E8E12_000642 [Didymella heteroderae]|uniref:MARVEL domain-containing protein n=1 Tax=Didymella heteroderae TaxID=1769908 RepID=A0A9P4WJ84_9PLEO|nr:hypothetical protein E8E12_000642 [Didymella heteroderae]
MGTGSKIVAVVLRLGELCSAIIVVSLLGRFFYLSNRGGGSTNGRLVYAEVISALEIIFSILLIIPAAYSFYAFPLDLIFFICSIVAFALLADLNGTCTSSWYYRYWGFYWGRFWSVPTVTPAVIGSAGCGSWRSILAFLFIGAMSWLLSAILGAVVFTELREGRETHHTTQIKEKVLHKKHHGEAAVIDPESQPCRGTSDISTTTPQTT